MNAAPTPSAPVGLEPIACFIDAATAAGYGVYQLFSGAGVLLYVGRTRNLQQRLTEHRSTQSWWPLVESGQWTPVANYGEAVALERASIEFDRPMFNQVGSVALRAGHALPHHLARELMGLYAESDTRAGAARTDAFMLALHDAGWSLAAIGMAVGLTRERVRQRIAHAQPDEASAIDAYKAARKPLATPEPRVWPSISESEIAEMRSLHAEATQLRGSHALGHPYRAASERLTELIAEAVMRGVRASDVARALSVTTGAIRMRLKTHGYNRTPPSQNRYGQKLHPIFATREEKAR